MIQQTTALRKLVKLRKRIWVVQGGQGAGKTIGILFIIINHASSTPNREIFIASKELSKMRITVIKDFIKIIKSIGIEVSSNDTLYRFASGSFIKFIGLDKEDIGKGLRSDLVFVNEANKVPFDTYRELTSRAKRIILDFNPNGEFWAHTEIVKRSDADFLTLTYTDNEHLSIEERTEIELYKTNAFYDPTLEKYDIPTNIKSKYWKNKWDVYGRGVIGSNPNRIFFWDEIPDEDYRNIDAQTYYGVDWGVVDPWGIIEVKYYDGALYIHELNYKSENEIKELLPTDELIQISEDEDGGLVKWMFNKLNIDKTKYIICDNNRPLKISALQDAGFDYAIAAPKPPGSIIDGITLVNEIKVYYTSSSVNAKKEQENYSRLVDRYGIVLEEPEDKDNHICDPTRYVALFLKFMGIIKK